MLFRAVTQERFLCQLYIRLGDYVGKQQSAAGDCYDKDKVRKRWIKSVGGVGAPVLAGFSFTAVITISSNPGQFRWPGPAAFALTLSSGFLIVAVQAAKRVDEGRRRARCQAAKKTQQLLARLSYLGMRTVYHVGIIALLLGLGLVLYPKQGAPGHEFLVWASRLAFFICGAESFFIVVGCWRERIGDVGKRADAPPRGALDAGASPGQGSP